MSLSKFEALGKVKPEVLRSLYLTADSGKQDAFNAVLEMVERLQNAGDDDSGKAKKRKVMVDLKVGEVSKSVMSTIVEHCNSLGAGLLFSLSLVSLILDVSRFRSR